MDNFEPDRRRRPRELVRPTPEQIEDGLHRKTLKKLCLQGWAPETKNLAGIDFSESDLSGANLWGADLTCARLTNARLVGARLGECKFDRADLHGADFTRASLHQANFTGANGLTQDQLRAARLPGAKLPGENFVFDGLDRVREFVSRAERTLYLVLLACVSVTVICLTSGDEQLFASSSALTLPGLNLSVTLAAFYQLAPILILGFYLSLLFTLRKLWVELANLPAIFPNTRRLFQQAAASTPSFVSVAAPYVEKEPSHVSDRIITLVTVWWAVPATLFFVLLSYLPRHDPTTTTIHLLVLAVCVGSGIRFFRGKHLVLAESFGPVELSADLVKSKAMRGLIATFLPLWNPHGRGTGTTAQSAPDQGVNVLGPRQGLAALFPPSRRQLGQAARWGAANAGLLAAVVAIPVVAIHAFASMAAPRCDERLAYSQMHATRCHRSAANLGYASLVGLQLPESNLRRAFMRSANLERAMLEGARLEYANLIGANLKQANLKDAYLSHAVLWEAVLDSARIKEARMPGADLQGASLRFAAAQGVRFPNADLRGVDWWQALVCGADFQGARVEAAALRRARGWTRALNTGLGTPPDRMEAFEDDSVPFYLEGSEKVEYLRWRRAWLASRQPPAGLAGTGQPVPYANIRRYLDTMDVSMGETRQRQKEQLLAQLARTPQENGSIVYDSAFSAAMDDFRGDVKRKARNHCVNVDA